jgi:hypothetical protein
MATKSDIQEKIASKLDRTMTVRDLIEALEDQDPDAYVVFADDYGDYCHTIQALLVNEVEPIDGKLALNRGYSESGLEIVCDEADDDQDGDCDSDDDDDDDDLELNVVVLRMN